MGNSERINCCDYCRFNNYTVFLTQNETLPAHQGDLMNAPVTQAAPKAEPEPEEIVPTSENVLVNASIIREEVTENATLAKEEIAKLEDIQQQLNEQEKA